MNIKSSYNFSYIVDNTNKTIVYINANYPYEHTKTVLTTCFNEKTHLIDEVWGLYRLFKEVYGDAIKHMIPITYTIPKTKP